MSIEAINEVKRTRMKPPHKLMAMLLADYCDTHWRCFPGVPRLALESGYSERQVKRILLEMEDLGIIRREERLTDAGRQERSSIYLSPEGLSNLGMTRVRGPEEGDILSPQTEGDILSGVTSETGGVTNGAEIEDLSFTKNHQKNHQSLSAVPVTPVTPTEDTAEFDFFWSLYPRKKERAAAKKKWETLIKKGTDPEAVIAGVKRYAAERAGQDPQFTKLPTTWLNKGCWEDEPDAPSPVARNGQRTLADKASQYDRVLGLLGEKAS